MRRRKGRVSRTRGEKKEGNEQQSSPAVFRIKNRPKNQQKFQRYADEMRNREEGGEEERKRKGGLSKYSIQNPLPPLPAEYYLSINFWPIFSKIKQISVDEYYFIEIPDPPPLFEY